MSGLVIYHSRYGSTQEYAEALAEELGWEALPYKKVNSSMLMNAGSIVLASNIRVGKMKIARWARSRTSLLKSKCKAVMAIGGKETGEQEYYVDLVKKNLAFLDLKDEQIFGLGGRKTMSEMRGVDLFMFKMLDKVMEAGPEKEEMMQDVDHVDVKHLDRIVEYLKKIKKE